jgi:hypothetical protein
MASIVLMEAGMKLVPFLGIHEVAHCVLDKLHLQDYKNT